MGRERNGPGRAITRSRPETGRQPSKAIECEGEPKENKCIQQMCSKEMVTDCVRRGQAHVPCGALGRRDRMRIKSHIRKYRYSWIF